MHALPGSPHHECMFIVSARSAAVTTAQSPSGPQQVSGPQESSPRVPSFDESRFEAAGAAPSSYRPTLAELDRPTPATVINITTGDRQPLNPAQMSTQQGVDFVQGRLQALGYQGPGVAANTSFPTSGPFRMDYAGDDRRHWDIDGINVGLAQRLYAQFPADVADRMLATDMQYARRQSFDDDGPTSVAPPAPFRPAPAFQPMRLLPGADVGRQLAAAQPVAPGSGWTPTAAELNRPTTAVSLNILTGERTPLNPAQMSNEQGIAFVRERLAALGYGGAANVSNQTAPTVGPFGIDYGSDDRRHWDLDGMNVGLTLQLYANNPREVADRMLADMLKQVGR